MLIRLVTTWQMVAKRSLSHWRLLSSVVIGVVLASAIMAGTVMYFDALRELALRRTLARHSDTELDILIQGRWGPATSPEYDKIATLVTEEINAHVAWMVTDRQRAGKSPTFLLTVPCDGDHAAEDKVRSDPLFFQPALGKHAPSVQRAPCRRGQRAELLRLPAWVRGAHHLRIRRPSPRRATVAAGRAPGA